VIEAGNYVSTNPSDLGNYVSADNSVLFQGGEADFNLGELSVTAMNTAVPRS
jgi:hypothetical protein